MTNNRRQRGFSSPEAVILIAVIAMTALSLGDTLISGTRAIGHMEEDSRILDQAQVIMGRLRQIPSATGSEPAPPAGQLAMLAPLENTFSGSPTGPAQNQGSGGNPWGYLPPNAQGNGYGLTQGGPPYGQGGPPYGQGGPPYGQGGTGGSIPLPPPIRITQLFTGLNITLTQVRQASPMVWQYMSGSREIFDGDGQWRIIVSRDLNDDGDLTDPMETASAAQQDLFRIEIRYDGRRILSSVRSRNPTE